MDLSATGRGQEGEFCGGGEAGVRKRKDGGSSSAALLWALRSPTFPFASQWNGESAADVRAQHVPTFVMQRAHWKLNVSPGLPGWLA